MRKTPLTRKTPLKRTGFAKKKPKAKTQSWYRKQVIERFMKPYRGKPCEICGTTHRTCAHHLISKRRCPAHLISDENIIVLCVNHHMMSNDMSAHSSNSLAVVRFMKWVMEHKPKQYAWMEAHEADSCKHRWKEIYEEGL